MALYFISCRYSGVNFSCERSSTGQRLALAGLPAHICGSCSLYLIGLCGSLCCVELCVCLGPLSRQESLVYETERRVGAKKIEKACRSKCRFLFTSLQTNIHLLLFSRIYLFTSSIETHLHRLTFRLPLRTVCTSEKSCMFPLDLRALTLIIWWILLTSINPFLQNKAEIIIELNDEEMTRFQVCLQYRPCLQFLQASVKKNSLFF